jgi:hypothetical protein
MKKSALLAVLCCLVGVSADAEIFQIGLNGTNAFSGTLNGALEVPANSSTATGGEVGVGISYDNATSQLDFNVAYGLFGFNPLQGNYTASHIHTGAVGVAGPVALDLAPIHFNVTTTSGFYQGVLTLSPALETALFSNNLYVNIHSTAFPGGEIRAQLIPTTVPEPTVCLLAGSGLAAWLMLRRRS